MLGSNHHREPANPPQEPGEPALPGEESGKRGGEADQEPPPGAEKAVAGEAQAAPLTYEQCLSIAEEVYAGMTRDGLVVAWHKLGEKHSREGATDATLAALEVIERLMAEGRKPE